MANKSKYSEIHIACSKCKPEKVSKLLDNGANPNASAKMGFTPLHMSALSGCAKTTSILLSSGANPNVFDACRNTPIQVAAREGHPEVLSELLDSEAYFTGTGALFYAAEDGNIDCVEVILEKDTKKVVMDEPSGQHEYSASLNWSHQLDPELNLSPNGTEPDLNPLHAAVKVDSGELVDLFLSYTEKTDPLRYQKSPLSTAGHVGAPEAAQRLLEHGFPPNYPKSDQPLNIACRSETSTYGGAASTASYEVTKTLAEYGADLQHLNDDVPDLCTKGGETPLTEAVKGDSEIKGDSIKCVRFLARRISERGDLPFKYNDMGLRPIHVAALYGSPRSVKPLVNAGVDIEAEVKNPDQNRDWYSGTTAIHIAAFEDNADVLEVLIEAGADPNCKDRRNGSTPLHLAVAHTSTKAESVLLGAGSDPEIANDSGKTPLDYKKSRGSSRGISKSSSAGSGWHGDWLKTDGRWIHRDQL